MKVEIPLMNRGAANAALTLITQGVDSGVRLSEIENLAQRKKIDLSR